MTIFQTRIPPLLFLAVAFAFLIPATTSLSANEPEAALDDEPLFPWVGEELYFSIRVNEAEAMRAVLRTGDIRTRGGTPYLPISGVARSRGVLHSFYPIDDRANTFLNPETNRPLHTEKTFDENGKTRSYNVTYQHDRFKAQVQRLRENREANFKSPIPDNTHDMLTWIYDLRRQGMNLSMGDQFSYYVYDGWLLSRIDLEVVGREDTLTPMGWFKTWKISFSREIMDATWAHVANDDVSEDDPPQAPSISLKEPARHTGHIWLSRDANLLPVKLTIDTMIGAGVALLIRYVPGQAQ